MYPRLYPHLYPHPYNVFGVSRLSRIAEVVDFFLVERRLPPLNKSEDRTTIRWQYYYQEASQMSRGWGQNFTQVQTSVIIFRAMMNRAAKEAPSAFEELHKLGEELHQRGIAQKIERGAVAAGLNLDRKALDDLVKTLKPHWKQQQHFIGPNGKKRYFNKTIGGRKR